MTRPPALSVVVPARNAERTIGQTLTCLLVQTSPDWEAIVVDDDSFDGTRSIADAYAQTDPRFRVLTSAAHSEGGARNVGLRAARGRFVLFLDADDLIEPPMVQAALAALRTGADGAVFGWARFDDDGRRYGADHWNDEADPFVRAASHSPFPIHACVVRTSLVRILGGFDADLWGVADWDLWLRVFRSGARLVRIGEPFALYRAHTGSMSRDATIMLRMSLRVLDRAHRPDPRVRLPKPRHADGAPPERRGSALLRHLCWWTGSAIAAGEDPQPLFDSVADEIAALGAGPEPLELAPDVAAVALRQSFGPAREVDPWSAWVHPVDPAARGLLERLESSTGIDAIAWRTQLLLRPAAWFDERLPRVRGDVMALDVELTEPIGAVETTSGVSSLAVVGRIGGRAYGLIDLPVTNGFVPAPTLRDGLAAAFFWDLCRVALEGQGLLRYGADRHAIWATLQRELWRATGPEDAPRLVLARARTVEVVAGEVLPRIIAIGRGVNLRVRIGGTTLDTVRIDASDARSRTRCARALAVAHGARLFRAVAREALVGRPPPADPLADVLRAAGDDEPDRTTAANRSP